jgi:hypothetical protein
MCQRFQNSRMLTARYGYEKFSGTAIPRSRENPIARSE